MVRAGGVEPPEARFKQSFYASPFDNIDICAVQRFTKPGPTPTPASLRTFSVTFASMMTSIFSIVRHRLAVSHAMPTAARHPRSPFAKLTIEVFHS